jgi:hypothetical protein
MGTELESSADLVYFRAIEEHYVALPNTLPYLSPEDFRLAQAWRRSGIPLELVRRVLSERAERRRAQTGQRARVWTLRYSDPHVRAEWERLQALTAPGERDAAPVIDVGSRLAALAAALPGDLAQRKRWAERITALGGSFEQVEEALAVLDGDLIAAIEGTLDDRERREHAAQAESALAAWRGRLAPAELERARRELLRRLLRRRYRLPVLSLFAPEAEPPGVGETP